jgi:hypothetical protein
MNLCWKIVFCVLLFLTISACSHRKPNEAPLICDPEAEIRVYRNIAGICEDPDNGMDHGIFMEEIRICPGNSVSIKIRNEDSQSIFLPKKAHFDIKDTNAGGISYALRTPISDDVLGDFIEVPAESSKEYIVKISDYFPDNSIKPILSLESLEIQGYYKHAKLKPLGKPTYLREGENILPNGFSCSYSFEKWTYLSFSLKYSKRYVQPKIIVEQ